MPGSFSTTELKWACWAVLSRTFLFVGFAWCFSCYSISSFLLNFSADEAILHWRDSLYFILVILNGRWIDKNVNQSICITFHFFVLCTAGQGRWSNCHFFRFWLWFSVCAACQKGCLIMFCYPVCCDRQFGYRSKKPLKRPDWFVLYKTRSMKRARRLIKVKINKLGKNGVRLR